ncbi:MAG: hypothetical protein OJJ21_16510 [Ferrovibrio sp.]|uniref:dienelactone hydrolase family protein n=1 Tax=Ferrovibrio sp. TaxID=1917215 RepID=UPI002629D68B|nr:hypothetical protein [Ferrovibrio sp.]MCW0235205.1 hypothetical protein [Ferrovibrio sp.]
MTALRLLSPVLLCLALAITMSLASCPSTPMENREDPVLWHLPQGQGQVPVVVLLEETSHARLTGRSPWIDWLLRQGIAVALVRQNDPQGRQDWLNGACSTSAPDIRAVLDLARATQPRIDTAHFAIMGAGRRGTQALSGAGAFARGDIPPTAIFAFYPGCADHCPIDYAADGPTQVHIFYGTADDWGMQRGAYRRCHQQAGGQIRFHSFANVGHGFDGRSRFTEISDRIVLRHQPDALAAELARSLVLATLALAWQIDN